jgi:O-antigen ligase
MRMPTQAPPASVLECGSPAWGAAALVGLSGLVGVAIAVGGPWTELAAAAGIVFAAGAVFAHRRPERLRRGFFVIELPIFLLIADVYYSHTRTANDLSQNPLDSGAMVKLAAISLAGLIGGLAYATSRTGTRTPVSFRLFALYATAVFFGIWSSVDPLLTGYRGIELAAAVLVIAGAYRRWGQEAVVRIERLLYRLIGALVLSVWLSVAVSPHVALIPLPRSPLHWQIAGVYPPIASNGVGTLGVMLALWSLGRLGATTPRYRMRRSHAIAFSALGVATLVAAQYRTGYAELAAGLALLLVLQRRKTLALVVVVVAIVGGVWGLSGATTKAQPFLLRGDSTQQAQQLSGRLHMWHSAIPFWRESPLFGRGLLTSTRLEVLPSIGYADTATIHSTWIETLVGTGLVGTVLLAACMLVLFGRAVVCALRPNGPVIPAILLLSLLVRSITGSSFESLGIGALIVMIFALDLSAEPRPEAGARVTKPRLAAAGLGLQRVSG